eukprot:bmy_20650T0
MKELVKEHPSHPLELSEKNFQLNQDKMSFSTLRNIQGLFAPLKLQMEFKAVQQVQHLPFLPSSNLSLDILRGNDETIGFEDILNDPSQSELMGEPHLMVEYKLGLLLKSMAEHYALTQTDRCAGLCCKLRLLGYGIQMT